MAKLDDIKKIHELDKSRMRDSISALSKQCDQAWQETKQVQVPEDYKKTNCILVNGMGGSAIGADIIKSLFYDELDVPLNIIHSYDLPEFVDENTLVLLSSYSGTTEEPLNTFDQAVAKKAKIIGITTGGKLKPLLEGINAPFYTFEAKHNPCGQPRLGIGYSVMGQLGLLNQTGHLDLTDKEEQGIISMLDEFNKELVPEVETKNNLAKQVAEKFSGKIPIIVASEFLEGNAHTFSNQTNENAKNFATYFMIPELNHHLLEGLAHPKKGTKDLFFFLVNSKLYKKENQFRYKVTQTTVKDNGVGCMEVMLKQKTKILQSFELLLLGEWIAFYMAMLNDLDPSPIPYVDFFKEELEKLKD